MKTNNIKLTKTILSFIFAICLCLSILLFSSPKHVSAENVEIKGENLLPSSPLEYYELNQPIDCFSDEDSTIIINKNGVEIVLYKNNEFYSNEYQYGAIAEVKKFGNDILYLNQKIINKLNTSTLDGEEVLVFDGEKMSTASGASFDCNNKYLATISDTGLFVYEFIDNTFVLLKQLPISNEKIAVNNNSFFYISENCIVKRDFESIHEYPTKIVDIDTLNIMEKDTIVANDNSLFYTLNGKLYYVDLTLDTPSAIELQSPKSDYDLGKFNNISGISLKDDSILITESISNSIQEFVIENNKLKFTGFAIAKNKTAYNRIDKSAFEIEKQGDKIAILDNNKLSIIFDNNAFDGKNIDNFINHFYLDTEKPLTFALGKDKFLSIYVDINGIYSAKIFDIDNANNFTNVEVFNTVVDVCYQSEYFYVLSRNGKDTTITKISEKDPLNTEIYALLENFSGELFTIDVFGNYYVYSQDKIYCNNIDTPISSLTEITKLETDLSGKIFALSNKKLYCFENSNFIDCNLLEDNITTFSLGFDTKDVYYIIENEEYVKKTDKLNNLSIDKIAVPNEFKITDNTSNNSQFKVYTIKENLKNCNVYHVDYLGENFVFNRLDTKQSEYAFICEIAVQNSNVKFFALAGQTGIVLINSVELEEKTINYTTNLTDKIYITTPVNCYYLPIIKGEFALSIDNVRLLRGQSVTPISLFTFLDVDFYYALVNDQTFAYIPKNFTTEVLSENVYYNSYRLEKVFATNVYLDNSLSENKVIATLSDEQQIKLISIDNGIAHILFEVDNGVVEGYIKASSIKNEPNTAVRNILIALGVIACACGSISYFLLRKKEND